MPLSEQPAARPRTPDERETKPESGASPLKGALSEQPSAIGAATTFTIVAAATAPVRGGVGILRLSGPAALPVSHALALDVPQSPAPRHAYLTNLSDRSGAPLDQGLFIYFQEPHSYTGEDVVELQTHGSPRLLEVLQRELLLDARVRLADPGEFTKRAFLNGRLDLTQAEAVADLVAAESEAALRAAAQQVSGEFSRRLVQIREPLIALRAEIEGLLNFPTETEDEEVDLESTLRDSLERANSLLADADRGRLVRRGSRVALVGPVNAGKSTLFNRLLGENRALVDADPGTTRDVVEGRFEFQGLGVTLLDTAGLRSQPGRLEALGIERTREAASSSDLVILVVPPEASEADVLMWSRELEVTAPLRVHSKSDLFQDRCAKERYVSGLTGEGVDELRGTLVSTLMGSHVPGAILLTSERHVQALHRFAAHLERALSAVHASTLEVVSGELAIALDTLGEVLGENASQDVLDAIFRRFCIGK
jgi:tRNA modification GTPase